MSDPVIIRTVDMHTAGEPVRIIEAGYPNSRARPFWKNAVTRWQITTTYAAL